MSCERFFQLLHDLFDAMSVRQYFFRDMQELIRYERCLPKSHTLIVSNADFNRGLWLLIAACEQADVRIRAEYLKVVEMLFAHVDDYSAAMEFAFSLEFFRRHNRLNSHKLADDYENFADSVHDIMDWIVSEDFDRDPAAIERCLGFFAIIHPMYVLRDVVKAAIVHLHVRTPAVERLFRICDRYPVLFRLRVPNPRREDSDTTEAAFLCVLRRFLVFEKRHLDMDCEESRIHFGRVMLAFVRSRFRVTGEGTVLLEKRSYFDPLDFVYNFIIDYLNKNHYVDFFLRLLEEIFITDEDENASQAAGDAVAPSKAAELERVYYRTQFPMTVDGQDDMVSMDVLFFMRVLIDIYDDKSARYRPLLRNVFYSLASRIDVEHGAAFFDDAMPIKCQWIVDSLETVGDDALRSSVADWFPGLFARAADSTPLPTRRTSDQHGAALNTVNNENNNA